MEKIDLLKDLCKTIDPYHPLTDEMKEKLRAVGIETFDDPFSITNQLLVLLDELENPPLIQ